MLQDGVALAFQLHAVFAHQGAPVAELTIHQSLQCRLKAAEDLAS